MQRSTSIPALWDVEFLKDRAQAAIERAEDARWERDWRSAEIYVQRRVADVFHSHRVCTLSRCRRARRCLGNAPLCWQHPVGQPQSREAREWIEATYARIQQERAAAAHEGRAPRVLCPSEGKARRGRPLRT